MSTETGSPRRRVVRYVASIGAFAAMLVVLFSAGARAQYVDCKVTTDLKTDPLTEIVSKDGVLSGTIVLADEFRYKQVTRTDGKPGCQPQLRRFYTDKESSGPLDPNAIHAPRPGPTLRGKLGDVVQITFLNQINLIDYGDSIDRWQQMTGDLNATPGAGCDAATLPSGSPTIPPPAYPQVGANPVYDSMPNCFHGSSTGNLHFHGTHTNPNGTADNVLIGVVASPRKAGMPVVTGASVADDFKRFFAECKSRLQANALNEWPVNWNSSPALLHWAKGPDTATFTSQRTLLQQYDAALPPVVQKPDPRALWPVDALQDAQGAWPQYYVGAFPYCFVLPNFPGKGQAADQRMGQAPGTQWYHAHKHGATMTNVANGMVGAFIIEGDGYDGVLNAYYNKYRTDTSKDWTRQQPTMVVNQLEDVPNMVTNKRGQAAFSINGQIAPNVTMYRGEVQMWRIVNASAISGFYLPQLPPGFTWRQMAQDGVQFDDGNYQSRAGHAVFVAPGNRIDILVQAPMSEPAVSAVRVVQSRSVSGAQGKWALAANDPAARAKLPTLLNINLVEPTAGQNPMEIMAKMPARPTFLKDIAASEIVNPKPRVLDFRTVNAGGTPQGPNSQHTINGEKFNEKEPWVIDKLNVAERWKIVNTSNGGVDHPFHIHINPFQVTEVFDPNAPLVDPKTNQAVTFTADVAGTPTLTVAPQFVVPGDTTKYPPEIAKLQCTLDPGNQATWKPCVKTPPQAGATNIWWDVFPIPDARKVGSTVIPGYFMLTSRFDDYPGEYVMHCHILAHEDRGMMKIVEVAPKPEDLLKYALMCHH